MDHRTIDRVSLEMARRVAAGLSEHPQWIDLALSNLDRWSKLNANAPGLLRCYEEWRAILRQPVETIRQILTAETDDAQRLRQNSPFVGILSPQEVWEIKRKHYDSRPT